MVGYVYEADGAASFGKGFGGEEAGGGVAGVGEREDGDDWDRSFGCGED